MRIHVPLVGGVPKTSVLLLIFDKPCESIRHRLEEMEEAVPREMRLSCMVVFTGNKGDSDRVRAHADRALSQLIEKLRTP